MKNNILQLHNQSERTVEKIDCPFSMPLRKGFLFSQRSSWQTEINQFLVTFRIVGYQFYKFLDKAVQYNIYHYPHTQR